MAVAARGEPGGSGDINLLAHLNALMHAQGELIDRLLSAERIITDRTIQGNDLRYQQRFDSQQEALTAARLAAEKAVTAALEAAEKAVAKAELAAERRFEAVNEFRGQLSDQAASFMPRSEYETAHSAIEDKVSGNTVRIERIEAGKQGAIDQRAAIFAIVLLIIGLVSVWAATRS